MSHDSVTAQGREIASRVERFIREKIVPFERDSRWTPHGPTAELVTEMRALAREAGLMTPHHPAGGHLSHRDTALVLRAAGLSPLGPVAVNVAAPDEGNMYLLGKVGSPQQQAHFLQPLLEGRVRSSFMMTEPAESNGAGSDPSMLMTTAEPDGEHWIINGRKCFSTGLDGASVAIVMAKTADGATMFLVDLPHPAIRIERVPDTIDSSMPGGHPTSMIENLRVHRDAVLGEVGAGFKYAQVRLSPARLTHCMRWLGACTRAQEIASEYAVKRQAFGRMLIDHEGTGYMLAENWIELKQCELLIDWCADELDSGKLATTESSITKVAVSEALFRIADRCVQVMGGTGVTRDTVVEQVFREVRAFRIYDGPTEVHKWSLAKSIKRETLARLGLAR
ncbi:MAG TPA: acyl-CoA dehydrogenase family protein [Steroidobacteraceae bacterium]|nr:acyl-CoA dehydrogenase family protein [Steroidobacteraceae bacterium]